MKNLLILIAVLLTVSFVLGDNIGKASEIQKVDLNLAKDEVSFSFLELPSGEASLIQTGLGENILVNTGGPYTSKALYERLQMYNVEKIHKLIITNLRNEYSANLIWLKKNFKIEEVIVSKSIEEKLINMYTFKEEQVIGWKEGDLKELVPNLFVKVLSSGNEESEEGNEIENTEQGMTLLFYYGNQQILYMGNTSANIEERIINKYQVKAKILKVGEFATEGTSQQFLEKINPQVAIIFHKENAPPASGIVERLSETWIDIYQTRQFGNITLKCDQESYEVITINEE